MIELEEWAQGTDPQRKVTQSFEIDWPTYEEAREMLRRFEVTEFLAGQSRPPIGSFRIETPGIANPGPQIEIDENQFRFAFESQPVDLHRRSYLLRLFVARLAGRSRFNLMTEQPLGNLQRPLNHLAALFADDDRRAKVRDLVHDAFGHFFVLDPTTSVGNVRIRLSSLPPPSPAVERGLSDESVAFHANAQPIDAMSDGVQAYVGLVSGAFSLAHRVILIDEPEAFLPPPLARRLGGALATLGHDRDTRVIVATHSADFVMGAVASATDTTIVRLTYDQAEGIATARMLEPTELRPLMSEPLLRSTRALDGLFHRAVVVGESDADRALYDEINRRLGEVGRGVPDALFLNAQNWSTEARVIGPLRRLGVPAAAVLDLDTLWNKASEWQKLYAAVGLGGRPEVARLETLRLGSANEVRERERAKTRGVQALPPAKRVQARELLTELNRWGIFVVPIGGLENWLKALALPKKRKHEWIVSALTRLGSNPSSADYLHPGRGDVWRFIDSIEEWVSDPARNGMP